ncbi:MAG: prolyl oligopeptidase family serine peptidase [Candidatus Latescibacteria bacterium]|nr:prolyl oligopeptidase family serine peptidase [Candidatus Latescibacterota bacterium]
MTYTYALILGIVQGLTEFLPVSSSGHLVLLQHILGLTDDMLMFDIFVHFGTLLAVLAVFRKSVFRLIFSGLDSFSSIVFDRISPGKIYRNSPDFRTIIAIIIGTIPAVLAGLLLQDFIENLFSSPYLVLAALSFTGIILILTFFVRENSERIGAMKGLVIGCAQALAITPGISRSGSTIAAALFLKSRRSDAGEFSFLLAIPVIAGATVLALKDAVETGFSSNPWGPIITGTIAAFLTGWVSLVMLIKIVKRGKIGYFGFYCLLISLAGFFILHNNNAGKSAESFKGPDMNIQEISIQSTYDNASQKAKYLKARGDKRPLLVALHTWSFNYEQDAAGEYFTRCYDRDWNCIFPDFRGPNNNSLAGGSEAALQDILDAVAWASENLSIDHRRIFLAGASGGGYMSLLSAGNSPSTWTAVSAWVPISDLVRWHEETLARDLRYYEDVENVCGGAPGVSPEVDREYKKRSPVSNLWRAHIIPVDINAGIHDGHAGKGGEGSVPVGHSIRAFNELAKAAGKHGDIIPEEVISYIEQNESVPEKTDEVIADSEIYGRKIHLRRNSGLARLTLFEGGHEIIYDAVFSWFEKF